MALRDLFASRRRNEPDPEAKAKTLAWRRALEDLRSLAAGRPELETAARTLGLVIEAAFGVADVASEASLHADPEILIAAWRVGVPAFRAGDAPPRLDPEVLRRRALGVCEALGPSNPNADALRAAFLASNAEPLALTWAELVLSGQPEKVGEAARARGLDAAFALSVLRLVLLPSLEVLSRRLDGLRPEGLWTRGECPNCGGPPLLAESRGLEQRRAWRCGLCAGDWQGDRLRCPFCGETDHRQLHYRFVEGEQERLRLDLCDTCGGSLPVVSTLGPISAPGLPVAELASAHLVAAASGGTDASDDAPGT